MPLTSIGLTFAPNDPTATAAPGPTTLALLVPGVMLVGTIARRRRRA